ncbi:MerR family transcriptional regulator [Goodfellowiella coeruleoviolacea]
MKPTTLRFYARAGLLSATRSEAGTGATTTPR